MNRQLEGGRSEALCQDPATDAHGVGWPSAIEARVGAAVGALYDWLAHNRVTRRPWAVIQTFSQAEGTLLSGSMAYYTFLSLLPLLMVAGFVIGTLAGADLEVRTALTSTFSRLFPGTQGSDLVGQVVRGRLALGIIGLVTLAYASSGFVGALTACLNRMWGVTTGRNPVGQKLLNLGVVSLLCVVLLTSAALTLWARHLAGALLGAEAGTAVALMDRLASPLSTLVVLLVLYCALPARRHAWSTQVPGAVFAAVGIELLKGGFSVWARHSAGLAALPRSALSGVLLLVWFGLLSQLILYGAALNVVWSSGGRDDAQPGAPS